MSPIGQATQPLLQALELGYRAVGAQRSRVLLAVSGGADSTALLLGSVQLAGLLELRLEVACLDHGLRPEAAAEGAQVQALAVRLGLPFHARALGVLPGPAAEERAREARYAALEAVRAERKLAWIATAHTANDQAETLLMRLSRGSALKGAAGVLPARGRVVRPMLRCTRLEVESFLGACRQGFIRDPMNEDRTLLRTRVREEVLPALVSAAGPSSIRHLADYAALAREDEELLSALAEDAYRRLGRGPGALDAAGVRALLPPLKRRVVARLLSGEGLAVDLPMLRRALAALERGGREGLARGLEINGAGGVLRCTRRGRRAPGGALALSEGEVVEDAAAGLCFGLTRRRPEGGPFIEVDASARTPLAIRRRLPGDRVAAGPRGGSRRLQDLLVDRRIRAEERDLLPVVADRDGKVLWVVGVWQAHPRTPSGLYLFIRPHTS